MTTDQTKKYLENNQSSLLTMMLQKEQSNLDPFASAVNNTINMSTSRRGSFIFKTGEVIANQGIKQVKLTPLKLNSLK